MSSRTCHFLKVLTPIGDKSLSSASLLLQPSSFFLPAKMYSIVTDESGLVQKNKGALASEEQNGSCLPPCQKCEGVFLQYFLWEHGQAPEGKSYSFVGTSP